MVWKIKWVPKTFLWNNTCAYYKQEDQIVKRQAYSGIEGPLQ